RPGTEGDLQIEYRFKLVKAGTADRFKASIVGRVYPDQRGEQEYTRLLERWKDQEQLLADSSLQGLALYIPEHRLLLHSSLTQELEKQGFGVNSTDHIRIPQLYGYISELRMLLMEDVPEPRLTESFGSPKLAEDLQIAARALLKLHHCPLKPAAPWVKEFKV